MNNLEKIYSNSKVTLEYVDGYFSYLKRIIDGFNKESLADFIDLLIQARDQGKTVYIIGNGGSAATASHMANDISIGSRTIKKHFKVISLTDNVAVMTCIGNDFGYDEIFKIQLEKILKPEDILVAISASGNSPNIIKAVNFAKDKGCRVVGLTGFDGGELRKLSDLSLHVPSEKGEYGPVEDMHMIFDHCLGSYINLYIKKLEE